MKTLPAEFDGHPIRRVYDEGTEAWWFSVIDVVQVLTDSNNARRYWSDLKRKLMQEAGSEQPYEKIVQFKLTAPDGKKRETDCATAETLLRIVQSIPSPKAEPIKLWLAKVGYERMQEMADPAQALDRARQTWQQQGRSDKEAKGLTSYILCDHMREPELIFTALAELSTRQIAERHNATGMAENKTAAQAGGRIARQARTQLESQTGQSVVTGDNYLPPAAPKAPKAAKALKAIPPAQASKAPKKP